VCLLFLFHVRSALVAIITLPVGILIAFIAMRTQGVGADIMSLGGIAIAIGAMIDAAMVMIENMHKHLERAITARQADLRAQGIAVPDHGKLSTSLLSARERWGIVAQASKEVGPALFFSLIIITVSFIPVFALEAQEGRLFQPLAWTKTLTMAAAALLSVTLVPVTMGLFIRGRIHPEHGNPIYRALVKVYRPVIEWVLRYRWPVVAAAFASLLVSYIPFSRIGSEFMPPLDEGTILYMPTTLPGIGVASARAALRRQDSILAAIPEVQSVFGKAGRASTATDPAGLDMFETTIVLKPEREWRDGMTAEKIVAEMDSLVNMPGFTNAWTMPIQGRIDMLATGIRTPVGIKIFGEDLRELERIGKQIEQAVQMVPGTRSVFAERAVSGFYLDVDIDRQAAARYGISVQDIQEVLASAIGGMTITQTVEGRQRYAVRVRYPQELRDAPEHLASEVLIPVAQSSTEGSAARAMNGMAAAPAPLRQAQIPLGQVASIRTVSGPMVVRTEDAFPTAWVYIDVAGRDIGSYVADARQMVEQMVALPTGYTLQWSGKYEYMQRARDRLLLVVPAVLLIIFLLLYLNFRSVGETMIVLLSLPFAWVGGVTIMAVLGYNWSVATAIGFIALAGVAAETGVVMLIYLDHAWDALRLQGKCGLPELYRAVMAGTVDRVRPKLMTVTAIIVGLLPILWATGTGASVMKRIAAPMVGGMIGAVIDELIVLPAVYSLWKEWQIRREDEVRARQSVASYHGSADAHAAPATAGGSSS
jgi:Cu(I)/Ag(I) efflux system membrane protein CusA/SilA